MKTLVINFISLCLAVSAATAQTAINKTIAVSKGQTIRMHFDYPELVRISTWDRNEISIQGSVSINGGENDDAFELKINTTGNVISIENEIKNMKTLPHRVTVWRNGEKTVFRDKSEWRKYKEEHGTHHTISEGIDMDILLEIKVPANVETRVEAVYGMVELRNFLGPVIVKATYGGVDAALSERNVGELIAETNYGTIYSNLDIKVDGNNSREEDFHMYVTAKPGTGPRYSLESTYGNVYLRKGN